METNGQIHHTHGMGDSVCECVIFPLTDLESQCIEQFDLFMEFGKMNEKVCDTRKEPNH